MKDGEQLNALSAIKFPLMICIVCIHVQCSSVYGSFDWYIIKFLGEIVGRIGVPLFLFVSGFMFFANIAKDCSTDNFFIIYKNKIRRRLRTLVVPYLLWNLIAIPFIFLKDGIEFNVNNIIHSFWDYTNVGTWFFPVNGVMWFLRDLFVVSLLAPVIFLLLKFCYVYIIIFSIVVLFVFHNTNFLDWSLLVSFMCFVLGGGISFNKIEILSFCRKYSLPLLILFLVLSVLHFCITYSSYSFLLKNVIIIIGSIAFIGTMNKFPTSICGINLLGLSMFIFASHPIIRYVAFYSINALNITVPLLEYFCRILLTVFLCSLFYVIGNKLLVSVQF